MHFNVEKYLTNEFARRFGRSEEQFFINGTGVNEPTGLLITAETGHYIDTSDSLSYDDIISLFFAAKPEFRKNGVLLESGRIDHSESDRNSQFELNRNSQCTLAN